MEQEQEFACDRSIYLSPDELEPNEANIKARPNESLATRSSRVLKMSESIQEIGQKYPVLVVETGIDAFEYQYVDGGCRVDAIRHLNDNGPSYSKLRRVWCTIVPGDSDLFRTAVTANLHRTQNSILEMGMICQEARERNGWKGRGASVKVAEYLGLLPSRVSEYEKIVRGATPDIKRRIESGEIQSVDAALKLMKIEDPAEREKVAERAAEIAKEEQRLFDLAAEVPANTTVEHIQQTADRLNGLNDVAEAYIEKLEKLDEHVEVVKPAKVKAKHVDAAARETDQPAGPRTRKQIVEFFEARTGPAYSLDVVEFCTLLVEWCAGQHTDKKVGDAFDRMVSLKSKTTKKGSK